NYEDGMARAFSACHQALQPDGRLVIVFANKKPDAWETLVAALIRAGFVVDASWPIQTEMGNRTRAMGSAALSSSVWLVCRKRPADARPGWDHLVLEEMQANIETQMREFWDAGIRGPDFLWAATGPALEAYSQHPIVRLANQPGQLMSVPDFLRHVRRMVVDFVVGRVLQREGEAAALDDLTAYYLLHRHSFQLANAPAGACILYALSCNTSDTELLRREILARTSGSAADPEDLDADDDAPADDGDSASPGDGPGSYFRLRGWKERRAANLGNDQDGRPAPLIDRVHRLLQLWAAGNEAAVDAFIEDQALRRQPLLPHVLQAVIELCSTPATSDERAKLEAIAKHLHGAGAAPAPVSAPILTGIEP
ncbi:MAG TPA: hypothetical protein VNF08_00265, partial [Acidimicrobiales bacterium]|nr:hypothetical protein [Acidimicrobiales bacterium]